jgi:excisionase family DNA binding protein
MPDLEFLTPADAAKVLNVGYSTLAKLRMNRNGPRFHKFGRVVRYSVDDLREWAANQTRACTIEDRAV